MSLVVLENASFRHPQAEKPVWSGVNLEVAPGDRLLLVGPSGAGKSTLLGVMTGLVPRLSAGKLTGRVELNYRQAGLVLQNPDAQLVTPTVFEEVAFALENRCWPVPRIRERVAAVLEQMGLAALASRRNTTLSGGEAQRLSLACALAQEPEIFFLDEPTAYLDPWAAAAFFQALTQTLAEKALVLVEHRAAEVKSLVTRALRLERQGGLSECPVQQLAPPFAAPPAVPSPAASSGASASGRSLRVEGLSHQYEGADPVWQGLRGEFLPGRIAAVMGPSGAGKSTLLKKLAGLLPSARATVWLGDQDVSRLPARKLYNQLLLLPQNPEHFFLHMTAAQEWLSTGADPGRIRAVAAQFGLDPACPLHPSMLSEGEKRRLTLALAFLDDRPVLLLDEPTYGLDHDSFAALVEGLRALRAQGRTLVVVTHSPELVRACADDLWWLERGQWQQRPVDQLSALLPEVQHV